MTQNNLVLHRVNRQDGWIALAVGLFALAIYVCVLAPDVLYGDSAEFQALAYTGGMTHETGYPVYLLLARLFGLLPVGTQAWRINLFSAFAGAYTLAGLYLITRRFARRGGALLSSLVLMVSYVFWSQSIIAEVYTPAAAFLMTGAGLLLHWGDDLARRGVWLFVAALLITCGLGVHLSLMLLAPAAALFVLYGMVWGSAEERARWPRHLGLAALGGALGLAAFYGLFAFYDSRPTPTSFVATTLFPSRDAWGLQEADMDSTPERFWLSVSGIQWRDAMNPPGLDYAAAWKTLWMGYLPREFTRPALALAAVGALAAFVIRRRGFVLLMTFLLTAFVAGLVYTPNDKYIFYLPAYLPLVCFTGIGADRVALWVGRILPAATLRRIAEGMALVILFGLCLVPFVDSRWKAVQTGRSGFVTDDYPYPVTRLDEPRLLAECAVSGMPESDPVLVMGWRAIYALYYVADVEGQHPGLVIYEALPHGTSVITPLLRETMKSALLAGRAVYTDDVYPELRQDFVFTRAGNPCPNLVLLKAMLRR